jgi:hypothetical protein
VPSYVQDCEMEAETDEALGVDEVIDVIVDPPVGSAVRITRTELTTVVPDSMTVVRTVSTAGVVVGNRVDEPSRPGRVPDNDALTPAIVLTVTPAQRTKLPSILHVGVAVAVGSVDPPL